MNTLLAAGAGDVLFVLLSPIVVVVAGYALGFAAHSCLVVIEQTAVGFDRVVWPQERTIDWYWKPFYLYGLLALWAVGIHSVAVRCLDLGGGQDLLLTLALVWLIWPVSLLSSLSGSSRLLVLRWHVLQRLGLGGRPLRLAAFYLITLLLPWPTLIVAWFAISGYQQAAQSLLAAGLDVVVEFGSLLIGLPLAGALAATTWLIYARLLGRLAWLAQIGGHMDEPPTAVADEDEDDVIDGVEVSQQVPAAPTEAIPADAPAAAVGAALPAPYALAEEPLPAPTVVPPFRWEAGRMPSPAPPRHEWRDLNEPPPDRNLRDDKPQRLPAGPPLPLLCGQVFHFPWYRSSLQAWLILTVGLAAVGLLARLMVAFR